MGVTIYDIAQKAGVSIATVSRVLNKNPRVSAETRSRVMQVAETLGYVPHPTAQSLARRKSSLVSAVIPMVTSYFFMEVLRGLQDRLGETDFDLLVYSARTMHEVNAQLERALHRGRSAGVLLFSSPIRDAELARMRRSGQPTVLVDCFHPDFDSVSIDNEQGGYLAARHLLGEGRRRIALIMANPVSVPAAERHRGYIRALTEARVDITDEYIVASDDEQLHGYTEAYGRQAMDQLLSLPTPP
ncbi:MAG: LacI family DNA-binding transcriptional regulator, partial [Rhodothermales bacterium]|nr:LacI family DNA-binding transcriptional regulator [Rhodothermales bacterium]